MDEKYVEAFNAVVGFVEDLWEVFGNPKKATPLALYRRLISHIKPTDADAVNKALSGFRQFLVTYEAALLNNELDKIPRGTVIKYGTSKTVYLEVQKYIHLSDSETREAIRQHLIAVSAILDPNAEKMDALEQRINDLNIDDSTHEGQFITGIMSKAKDSMENVDTDNPGQAIMGLLSSGVIQDMVVGLQSGVASGEMDMQKLLGSMQTAIGALMPPPATANGSAPPAGANMEEVIDEEAEVHVDDEK